MGLNNNKRRQNQGAAMIVAIVVSVILTVFVLSLLLLSYSLFASATGKTIELQCKELAISIDKELGEELLNTEYDSFDEQYAAAGTENNLWFFLRYNLWQDASWPYYNEGESGHEMTDACRYFTIEENASEKNGMVVDKISVTMYWENLSIDTEDEEDKSFTVLHVSTEVEKGDYAYAMESSYALTVTSYDTDEESYDTEGLSDSSINPDNNEIVKNEKWNWTPD